MEHELPYAALADALRERLAIIADRDHATKDPLGHIARLKAVSEKIDILRSRLPADIPGRLDHFLAGCSYDKALTFIEENFPATRAR